MRVRRLDLVRYGRFTERTLDFGEHVDGEPDLHIVYGPNEARKSTACAGLLDLLFGIEMQSRYGFLHPYATMRIGGCIELSVGVRELVRIKGRGSTLRDAGHAPVAESLILGDLGGLDRQASRTMFSLDDDTLEAGGKSILDSRGELGQLLFSASAGLSDLSRTLLDLRLETEGFTKPHARSGELQQLKAALATLKQERDAIDTLASDYNRLAAARDAAAAQYATALAERAGVQVSLARLQRLLAAMPRMDALRRLRARLEPLADLPEAPPGWLDELPALQRGEADHCVQAELAEAEVARLGGVVGDPPALLLVGHLGRLTELRARHETAELDLPDRRRERARAEGELAAILTRLGREAEPAPARLLLSAAQSAGLASLMASRSGVEAKLTAAADELSQALHNLTEARRALHEAAGTAAPPPLAPVVAALAALRESDQAIRLRSAAKIRAQQSEALAARAAALAPWAGSMQTLAALCMPDAACVEAWQAAAERDEALLAHRREDVERIDSDVQRPAVELDAIGKTTGVLSDQAAGKIRRVREAAWAEHRRRLDPATADRFEAALRHDDVVSGASLGRERERARLEESLQALAIRRAEAEQARTLLEAAAAQRQRHGDGVAQVIGEIDAALAGDLSPAGLLAWMARRDKALECWALLRQAERDVDEAQADAQILHDRLRAALVGAEVAFDPLDPPHAWAVAAQAAVDREAQVQVQRQAVADGERDIRKRELAVQKAALADRTWQTAWHAACSACWLGPEAAALALDAVGEMLAAAAALGPALQARASLTDRIRGMEQDQAAFWHELQRLTPALGIAEGSHTGPELAQTVIDRVQAAQPRRYGATPSAGRSCRGAGAAAPGSGRRAGACPPGWRDDHVHAGRLADRAGRAAAGCRAEDGAATAGGAGRTRHSGDTARREPARGAGLA